MISVEKTPSLNPSATLSPLNLNSAQLANSIATLGRAHSTPSTPSTTPATFRVSRSHKMPFQEYQVVGRHLPTESDPTPKIYRMRIFAPMRLLRSHGSGTSYDN
ncbi:hypothetical protein A0H81_02466 [Grifola frondosa]|uniref:Uncharacterized protein n=1 Tax=Grifola frondosa TaxID=5627 RepID=A0A1C7MPJ0_GRIFR|nr:hypothetical protein A0H81_02466 [Grifola frondosa]